MKNFFIFLVFAFLVFSNEIYAANCGISGEIGECNSALKSYIKGDGSYVTPGASLREIEDFVCLQDVPERRVFQIAMDKNFREIDKEMDEYLTNLANSKDVYFGKNAQYTYLDGINHISSKSTYFKNLLLSACTKTLLDASECVESTAYALSEERRAVSVEQANEYIKGSDGVCSSLTNVKTEIFKQVAYNMLSLNMQQVNRDEKKLYDQEIRTKYDKVLDLMMINLGYLERIRKKWPSKTKNVR